MGRKVLMGKIKIKWVCDTLRSITQFTESVGGNSQIIKFADQDRKLGRADFLTHIFSFAQWDPQSGGRVYDPAK